MEGTCPVFRLSGPCVAVSLRPRKRYCTSVSKYDVERQEQIRLRILRIARQLVAGEIGEIAAARELGYLRYEVEPQVAKVLLTFTGIDSETDALPVGGVRKE